MVRAEYSVPLWANRENRPRLIMGAHTTTAARLRIERRETINCRKLNSLAQPRQDPAQEAWAGRNARRLLHGLKDYDEQDRRNRYGPRRRDGGRGRAPGCGRRPPGGDRW